MPRQHVPTSLALLVGLAGASAVMLGAFGAHALRQVLDPQHRELVATFGDLSSTAMSMLGGHDPGEIKDPGPGRATAARRLAGMGVDIAADDEHRVVRCVPAGLPR